MLESAAMASPPNPSTSNERLVRWKRHADLATVGELESGETVVGVALGEIYEGAIRTTFLQPWYHEMLFITERRLLVGILKQWFPPAQMGRRVHPAEILAVGPRRTDQPIHIPSSNRAMIEERTKVRALEVGRYRFDVLKGWWLHDIAY